MAGRPGTNFGGGPKTEAGRNTALANLDPKAAQKHGLRAWQQRGLFPVCRKCVAKDECEAYDEGGTCRIAEDHQNSIIRDVMALPHITEEDRPAVVEYAKCAVGIGLCDLYLSVAGGPFLPGADKGFVDVQPATKYRADLTKTLLNYANALGLTPAARARLKTEEKGKFGELAAALAAMGGQQAEAKKADAIDADFSAEDSDKETNNHGDEQGTAAEGHGGESGTPERTRRTGSDGDATAGGADSGSDGRRVGEACAGSG